MKLALTILGSLILLVGILSWAVMPGATLLIIAGCTLLICSSERAANKIRALRTTKPKFNKSMTWIEEKAGPRLSGPMRATRPIVPPVQDQNV